MIVFLKLKPLLITDFLNIKVCEMRAYQLKSLPYKIMITLYTLFQLLQKVPIVITICYN